MRTPRELPILIIRALVPTPIAASVTEVWTHCNHRHILGQGPYRLPSTSGSRSNNLELRQIPGVVQASSDLLLG